MEYRELLPIMKKFNELSDSEFNDYAKRRRNVEEDDDFTFRDKLSTLVFILRAWIATSLEDEELKYMISEYIRSADYESYLKICLEFHRIDPSEITHENKEFLLLLVLNLHSFY